MKKTMFIVMIILISASCNKNETNKPLVHVHPKMNYIDLQDKTVAFGEHVLIDMDNNAANDILFSTALIGDPVQQQDKKQWLVNSSFSTNLPVKDEKIPLLQNGDSISTGNFHGYEWFNASSILLAQKIIDMVQPPWWEGSWRQASHHYLPFQLNKNGQLFNGWVEVSFSTVAEKLTLHKAAVSLEANKKIIAGR